MTYTVKQLAKLSGISVRTLHHYDQIGLLRPAYQGDNRYRYYEKEQLLMLQQILFYRDLDMPLKDIKRILTSNTFSKVNALNAHKRVLKMEFVRIKQKIKTIDKTVKHLQGEGKMKNEELFFGFQSTRQKKYEKYLIERGVCTEDEINSWREAAKKLDWEAINQEWDLLFKEYADAIQKNLKPASPKVQKLVRRHFENLSHIDKPSKEKFIGLIQQYHSHPDWLKMFKQYHPQLLEFMSHAMKIFADREL